MAELGICIIYDNNFKTPDILILKIPSVFKGEMSELSS